MVQGSRFKVQGSRFKVPRSDAHRYTLSPVKHTIIVIPAWMPESSAMDGNLLAPTGA